MQTVVKAKDERIRTSRIASGENEDTGFPDLITW